MEILIVSLILNLIGRLLKKLSFIKDNFIPEILLVLGIGLLCGYYAIMGQFDLVTAVTNGVAAAAGSVYLHQIVKQLIEYLPVDDTTKDALQDAADKTLKDK